MLDTIRRRFPPLKVVLSPTQVQGDRAPQGILTALQELIRIVNPDVILLARGGGSLEDLMAFNDEQVARAIAESPIPIITGIGHETDFTIADFAADLRAPTPTAAAELATPNQADLRLSLGELSRDIHQLTMNYLYTQRTRLEGQQNLLSLRTPLAQIRRGQQRLDELISRVERSLIHTIEINNTRLAGLELRLNALNPQAVLERGYAIVTQTGGDLVRSIKQVDQFGNRSQQAPECFRVTSRAVLRRLKRPANDVVCKGVQQNPGTVITVGLNNDGLVNSIDVMLFVDKWLCSDVLLSEDELAKRLQSWQPPTPHYTTGVMAKYAKLVSSASEGAVTG